LEIMMAGEPIPRGTAGERVRRMFTRECLLHADWYRQRLSIKQRRDVALWRRHLDYLDQVLDRRAENGRLGSIDLSARRRKAEVELARVVSPRYLDELMGSLGANPLKPRTTPGRRGGATNEYLATEEPVGRAL
jgi:hypothetical protein